MGWFNKLRKETAVSDSSESYIPIRSEDFDLAVGIDGNIKFKDKSGMTGFARRHGGWVNGMFGAVFLLIATGFVALLAVMFMPESWSGDVKAEILIGLCLVGFVGPLVILAFYIKWRWMKWVIVGLAVLSLVLYGAGVALDALAPGF